MILLPDKYKNETDYRKIPREYLNPNIPKGRTSIKWQPFATIPLQYEMLKQHMEDQNKTQRPVLSDDQMMIINEIIHIKLHYDEIAYIKYWENGYIHTIEAYIKQIDTLNQKLILLNNRGTQNISLYLKNIINIE